jgi:dTDP-4-amino-4,6-dideoxygalactose transaminase
MFDALRQEGRKRIILPAFICSQLPAMAVATGMETRLIDVAPGTLHMRPGDVRQCLREGRDAETVLLVDHCFGHPFAESAELRREHPGLLIVEDCARALGSTIGGRPVGHTGDWILLSLYKTTLGNDHGAVLLTRTPYAPRTGPPPNVTWRQRASGWPLLRAGRRALRLGRATFGPTRRDRESISWSPDIGVPNDLCLARFARSIERLDEESDRRRQAAVRIMDITADIDGIHWVAAAPECESCSYFVTFTTASSCDRNRLLAELSRRGILLWRTWDLVPAYVKMFQACFWRGSAGSTFLANHVAHVVVDQFSGRRQLAALRAALKDAIVEQTVRPPATEFRPCPGERPLPAPAVR